MGLRALNNTSPLLSEMYKGQISNFVVSYKLGLSTNNTALLTLRGLYHIYPAVSHYYAKFNLIRDKALNTIQYHLYTYMR
jgi:hypothetical protein